MRITRHAVAFFTAAVLGLAACGDGEPQVSDGATDPTTEVTPDGAAEDSEGAGDEPAPEDTGTHTGAAAGLPGEGAVTVRGFRFLPDSLTVPAGAQVTWSNEDTGPHTITTGTPEEPTGLLDLRLTGAGETVTFTFEEPDTYDYFCDIHPSMRGEVSVR